MFPTAQRGKILMLTTTIDGLWVLQVLSGIEVLAPELGLRPHLPSAETAAAALNHPAAKELRQAGVIDDGGDVDAVIAEWLTVIARRDVALFLQVQTSGQSMELDQVLLARFAQWWVALERHGDMVRLSSAGTATSEQSAGVVIRQQIERLVGSLIAAEVRPATLDTVQLISDVRERRDLGRALRRQGLCDEQVRTVVAACDSASSTQMSIVAIQSGVEQRTARTHIESGAVTVIDSAAGRLMVEHTTGHGRSWMIVAPGSASQIASAVQAMLRRLPAQADWHSYRKAV